MAGQIDEEVLKNFRVGEGDFKDLDSIVRRHCQVVKYYVYRGSTLGGNDTDDVEVLLRERNGAEMGKSVTLRAPDRMGLSSTWTFTIRWASTVSVKIELASYCLQSKPVGNTGQNERRNAATVEYTVRCRGDLFLYRLSRIPAIPKLSRE